MTDKKKVVCKICSTNRGLVKKYNLYICRRCFKNNAINLGFKKYN
ncbi:MAG: 30S ribosomal protein S14 [Candidatus Diapherotrites archaeon CG09_land_8_20_14_0_10_32_12]|nr:MAG: 30S ribosomal protein S14 [Candidatus Diapherotrites archaeon CG09_land_8_20_14_0_10_32_12]